MKRGTPSSPGESYLGVEQMHAPAQAVQAYFDAWDAVQAILDLLTAHGTYSEPVGGKT